MLNQVLRKKIFGVPVDVIDMQGALEQIDYLISSGKKGSSILAINPKKIVSLDLRDVLERSSLLIPDGISVIFALRLLHGVRTTRVTGADLMQNLCRLSAERGYGVFLFGAREDVNRATADRLAASHPGLRIAGRRHGYLDDAEMLELVKEINQSGTDILFVALGSPKQEEWIVKYQPFLNVKICQGVGGTFDTIAERVKRAPKLFQKTGLEWLYRLLKEPWRAKRQLVAFKFVARVIMERMRSI